ncbi:MAG TPA: M23 family metallopeptidase [Candidatus Saccharimonadales bacterium]|nr:M23 family metallopeptidase [Candidatus Saccharimonadales bacterium]
MRKRYIPPRQRRVWQRVRISTVGLTLTAASALGFISLVSLLQSNWYTAPVQAQTEQTQVQPDKISDTVVAVKANPEFQNNQPAQRINNFNVDLATLPLERNWPVRGTITTRFSSFHPAIDIAAPRGTPIHPFASGVVVSAGWQGSFGRAVIIVHANGYETTYAHMNAINVTAGQSVGPGDVIGQVGSTGLATGPHLHFQLTQNGHYLNPLSALP